MAFSNTTSVQLGRFLDGRLELFSAQMRRVEYIAVSHVWGEAEWLHIASIGREVYASPQKAEFIRSQLPTLVGSTPFWMDTLTVNQKDQAEVLSIVQIIPTIFRHATKTLAIREDDGFYDCCAHGIDASDSWQTIGQKIKEHAHDEHMSNVYRESFLLRLWTLQECLLSHTIQFVKCGKGEVPSKLEISSSRF
jgi:Heterokaryon incompatibility protein (HET)